LLIQHGIDVNGKNKDGWNALMLLCRYYANEHLIDIVQLLIEKGIDLNSRTLNGSNALLILCANYPKDNLIAIVKLLPDTGLTPIARTVMGAMQSDTCDAGTKVPTFWK
jgi:ankyrin repeat protein